MNPALSSRLGKYEATAITSVRAQQLANNAPTTLEVVPPHCNNAIDLALEELRTGRLPLKLRRHFINGESKVVTLDELNLYH